MVGVMQCNITEFLYLYLMYVLRMFEVKATLPIEKDLYVRVKDYDLVGSDDTVGETIIDLENRFLTQHRAIAGLPKTYCTLVEPIFCSSHALHKALQKPNVLLFDFYIMALE